MIVQVKIVSTEGVVDFSATTGKQVWRREYSSMKAAAGDAEEMGIIQPDMERFLSISVPMPDYPHGFEGVAEIEPDELARRGFVRAVTVS